jgi:hypothetical protein
VSGVVNTVDAIHVMSDGRVLLNDGSRRRLLLFDSTLKGFTISADTAAGARVNYGVASDALANLSKPCPCLAGRQHEQRGGRGDRQQVAITGNEHVCRPADR